MFFFALAVKMEIFFFEWATFRLKYLIETFTHKYLASHFFYSLSRSNRVRNSKGYCWQTFLNIPLGSTKSFLQNISKNSANISMSPHIKYLSLILWKLIMANLANACIFHRYIWLTLTLNSSFVWKIYHT